MTDTINLIDNNLILNDFQPENHITHIKNILIYLNEYYDIIFNHSYKSDDPGQTLLKDNMIKLCNNNNLLNDLVNKINIINKDVVNIKSLLDWLSDITIITHIIDMDIDIIKLLNIHYMELLPKYNKIVLLRKKENDELYKFNHYIYREIFKKIIQELNITNTNNNNKDDPHNKLHDLMSILSNSVVNNILLFEAYNIIVSNLIEYFDKNNMIYLINSIILNNENLKNIIINSEIQYDNITSIHDFKVNPMKEIIIKKNIKESNPYIKTFGLAPISKYDTLCNIVNIVLKNVIIKKKIKKESDLLSITELNNEYCFILINKSIISPIEFDIWKLYDKKESENYKQEKNSGVNQLFINKFNTIKFVGKNKKWNNDIKIYGKILDNTEKFIIIEKLNSEKYRILKKYKPPQLINKRFNSFNERIQYQEMNHYTNDKDNITGLLRFIKDDQFSNTGDRINQYNNIIERKILNNMFLENHIDVNELSENAKIIDIPLLKYNLINEINDEINNLLKKKYKKIQKKKDIIDLLHEDCIISVFSQFLINQYLKYISDRFKNYKNASKLYYINDILKTFMSQLLILKISLKKKIHDEYLNKESLLDEIIDKSSKKIQSNDTNINNQKLQISNNDIKYFFDELFISIIDLLITDNDNIYLSLIYKTKLLELSLY